MPELLLFGIFDPVKAGSQAGSAEVGKQNKKFINCFKAAMFSSCELAVVAQSCMRADVRDAVTKIGYYAKIWLLCNIRMSSICGMD